MTQPRLESVGPGVWRISLGQPEAATPARLRHRKPALERMKTLPAADCPFTTADFLTQATPRGFVVAMPLAKDEQLYGLGLQLKSVNQRGRKKTLRVNSDPTADLGDSHAPVPFFVSSAGYGVLVDTARYATFYMGAAAVRSGPLCRHPEWSSSARAVTEGAVSAEELYASQQHQRPVDVVVEIPAATGVDVYVFAGPAMRDAIARYNLFSGGGCVPPRWGLGVWYRPHGGFTQEQAQTLAEAIHADAMPCDVYGLEPGWLSAAYSCTWMWNKNFPQPTEFVQRLAKLGMKVNLWVHLFTHVDNPLYKQLEPLSGSVGVWNGLVPDLTLPATRAMIAEHFERTHVCHNISGYKIDECDNSDFIPSAWSFGEFGQFPSGLDGEQFHSLFGQSCQEMIESIFRRRDERTYGQVRNAHALAANYPFVLYSDLYGHRDFIRGLVNTGFSGLLWSPEVRDAASAEDLIRRLQSVVLSPQALINAWYIKNPPWKQWVTEENNAGRFLPDADELTATCRRILELRMQLVPYVYAAFYEYFLRGVPPFRAPVVDWPADVALHRIEDQWMIGDRLMAAPVVAGQSERDVVLPPGAWRDFWTGQPLAGGRTIHVTVPLEQIPLFVRDNCLLPLAKPTQSTADTASFELDVQVFGDGSLGATLFEDDGKTYGYERGEFTRVDLTWDAAGCGGRVNRAGQGDFPMYSVTRWVQR
jgi:alpha-D-xyloside xylohydrolase